jgi:clathrin heavy chain
MIVLKGVLFLARASVTCFIANRTLHIFNIDTKQKVKSHLNSEDVVFWKWVSDTIISLGTESAIYH